VLLLSREQPFDKRREDPLPIDPERVAEVLDGALVEAPEEIFALHSPSSRECGAHLGDASSVHLTQPVLVKKRLQVVAAQRG